MTAENGRAAPTPDGVGCAGAAAPGSAVVLALGGAVAAADTLSFSPNAWIRKGKELNPDMLRPRTGLIDVILTAACVDARSGLMGILILLALPAAGSCVSPLAPAPPDSFVDARDGFVGAVRVALLVAAEAPAFETEVRWSLSAMCSA